MKNIIWGRSWKVSLYINQPDFDIFDILLLVIGIERYLF
jgi:hypothetical protein